MKLPINEIFSTVQGEGSFTGTPSIFIRLQYCDVGCPWCDTKHTWELNTDYEIPVDTMIKKTTDSARWAYFDIEHLLDYLHKQPERHVVLTGGEPCAYNLEELTAGLLHGDRTVQIETSGTYDIRCDETAFVTVSPKVGMPGGRGVLLSALQRADELKMPIGKMADVDALRTLLATMPTEMYHQLVYLQPLSQSPKATELCIEQARQNGWRVSVQAHKFMGLR